MEFFNNKIGIIYTITMYASIHTNAVDAARFEQIAARDLRRESAKAKNFLKIEFI